MYGIDWAEGGKSTPMIRVNAFVLRLSLGRLITHLWRFALKPESSLALFANLTFANCASRVAAYRNRTAQYCTVKQQLESGDRRGGEVTYMITISDKYPI